MNDERPQMIRHRLTSIAEGKWCTASMRDEIGPEMVSRIETKAREILAALERAATPQNEA